MKNKVSLLVAMAMMAEQLGMKKIDWGGARQDPIDLGRRTKKDNIALAKTEAKRQRKAAKRVNGKAPNLTSISPQITPK
jgi:ribosomal protein L15E